MPTCMSYTSSASLPRSQTSSRVCGTAMPKACFMPILLLAAFPNPKRAQDSPTPAAEANRNFGRTAAPLRAGKAPLGIGGLGGAAAVRRDGDPQRRNRHRKGACAPPRQLGFDPASLNRPRRFGLFKHDLRANASRLSRGKTGILRNRSAFVQSQKCGLRFGKLILLEA